MPSYDMEQFVADWKQLCDDLLAPPHLPRHSPYCLRASASARSDPAKAWQRVT